MPLFDIFKKKKKPASLPAEVPLGAKAGAKAKPKAKAPLKPQPAAPKASHSGGQAWRVLKQPHVTEKATDLNKQSQYVFKIWPNANKIDVKKAIEDLYGVDVQGVNVIKVPRKRRRLGRIRGWRKGYKKAIVKLKKGQKIEVLSR